MNGSWRECDIIKNSVWLQGGETNKKRAPFLKLMYMVWQGGTNPPNSLVQHLEEVNQSCQRENSKKYRKIHSRLSRGSQLCHHIHALLTDKCSSEKTTLCCVLHHLNNTLVTHIDFGEAEWHAASSKELIMSTSGFDRCFRESSVNLGLNVWRETTTPSLLVFPLLMNRHFFVLLLRSHCGVSELREQTEWHKVTKWLHSFICLQQVAAQSDKQWVSESYWRVSETHVWIFNQRD